MILHQRRNKHKTFSYISNLQVYSMQWWMVAVDCRLDNCCAICFSLSAKVERMRFSSTFFSFSCFSSICFCEQLCSVGLAEVYLKLYELYFQWIVKWSKKELWYQLAKCTQYANKLRLIWIRNEKSRNEREKCDEINGKVSKHILNGNSFHYYFRWSFFFSLHFCVAWKRHLHRRKNNCGMWNSLMNIFFENENEWIIFGKHVLLELA